MFSYTKIWYYVWKNNKYFDKTNITWWVYLIEIIKHAIWNRKKYYLLFSSQVNVTKSESKLRWTLFMVTFTFVLLVTPRVIYTVLGGSIHASGFSYEKDPWIDLILYCMYWGHYAINFFIYVVRIQTYRSAYYFFLKEVRISFT